MLDPNAEEASFNFKKIFESLFKEDYGKLRDLLDRTYYLTLKTTLQQGSIAGELEEMIYDKHFSIELARNVFEGIINSLREDASKKYSSLEQIAKIQEKYNFTSAPKE
jgi:hypothetical protein